MRSNSGQDEARDNLHDPTLREKTADATKAKKRSSGDGKAPADQREGRKD